MLLATGRLPVTYHQVWAFSVSSWLLAFAGWAILGFSLSAGNRPIAVLVWVVAVGLGAVIAWVRPVHAVRSRVRPA